MRPHQNIRHFDVPKKKFNRSSWYRATGNSVCSNIACGFNAKDFSFSSLRCPQCKSDMIYLGTRIRIPRKNSRRWESFYKRIVLPRYEKNQESIRKEKVDSQSGDKS